MLTKFFFSWFLIYLPLIISGIMVLVVLLNSLIPNRKYLLFLKKIKTINLVYILVGLSILFNSLLSILQYFVWHISPISRFLLPPFTPINYFLGYIFFHFWLAGLLVFVLSLAFYFLLKLIKKYRDDVVSSEELFLILLSGLLVGWPNFIIFVPLFFLLALIYSSVNLLVFKREKNSLLQPLIFSLIIVFFTGSYLIKLLYLSALVM